MPPSESVTAIKGQKALWAMTIGASPTILNDKKAIDLVVGNGKKGERQDGIKRIMLEEKNLQT